MDDQIFESETEVSGHADGTELRTILFDNTDPEVSEESVDACLDKLGVSLAEWLEKSAPLNENGERRGSAKGVLSLHLKRVAESQGTGFAKDEIIPEHFALYIKASEGMLRAFSERFGIPVKNG